MNQYCECPETGLDEAAGGAPDSWYDAVTERPFVKHEPHECRCTNNLRRYKRGDKILMLCSCCNVSGDQEIFDA